jgi:adenine-specific DNA methylase
MELKTAIEILEYYQQWRLGKKEDMIHEPKKLTEALDMVLCEVKKNFSVSGRSEQCAHPRDKREYVGSNMLRCKVCGKEFS